MRNNKANWKVLLVAMGCFATTAGIGAVALRNNAVTANADTALEQEFTNNGQFQVAQASIKARTYSIVDGATLANLPAGYTGAVLGVEHRDSEADGYDCISLDFSASNILAADVKSIVVRCWVEDFHSASDEFRTYKTGSNAAAQYGIGAYDLSKWCDVTLTEDSIKQMTDANGYLSALDVGIRDKGGASHFYIDSVTVNLVQYTEYNFGKLGLTRESLSAPATNRLYLTLANGAKLDANGSNSDFTYLSGTGFVINGQAFKDGLKFKQGDVTSFFRFYNDVYGMEEVLQNTTLPATITVGGTFINRAKGLKYTFEDTQFIWDGSAYAPAEYTTYNVGAVQFSHISEGKPYQAYFKKLDNSGIPSAYGGQNDVHWENKYSFREGTGAGVLLNGNPVDLSARTLKFPGSVFLDFGTTPNTGDILTIGGTFYNATLAVEYTIEESKFQWNGAAWVSYAENETEYETYNIGALVFHVNTSVGGAAGVSSQLYLSRADGEALPVLTWDELFVAENVNNFKINGQPANVSEIKSTGDGFWWNFGDRAAGDVVTISGSFVCENLQKRYVIEESHFQWTGSGWVIYKPYNIYEIGNVVIGANSSASAVYFNKASGAAFEITEGTWTEKLTFEAGSGVGVTLNGTQINMNDIKIPNNIYVGLGATAQTGDILVIGGTFYNETLNVKYVVEESMFKWDGTSWVEYVPFATYEIGKVAIANGSSASAVYFYKASGAKFEVTEGTWTEKLSFEAGSGIGVTLNGTQINMNDIKIPNDIYVALGATAQTGDVLAIGGAFYNENLAVKYVIEESKFVWNGSAWEKYIPPVQYATYEIGNVAIGANSSASAVYFDKASGAKFEITEGTWTEKLSFEAGSGIGVTLNGAQIVMDDIKIPNNIYVNLKSTAQKGDVLAIGGTFYNESLAVKYVIEESKFVWNGSAWENYVEYTTYNVGKVLPTSGGETSVYFYSENVDFEIVDGTWAEKLSFEAGSGIGVTFNGQQIVMDDIKIPGDIFVNLKATAKAGDVVRIGGTFYNANLGVKYVIAESAAEFNGTKWVSTYEDSDLAVYDTVTMLDLDLGLEQKVEGVLDGAGCKYMASSNNTTGSLKFRFGYNSADVNAGNIDIRFRGSEWDGIMARIAWGGIYLNNTEYTKLQNNTDYVIEMGVIDLADGSGVWGYVRLNGALIGSQVFTTEFSTNHLSFYANNVAASTFTDPDHVVVTYNSNAGTVVDYAEKGADYTLSVAKGYETFIAWEVDGELYQAGKTIVIGESNVEFNAVCIEFAMEDGAAIRLADSADESGIRFTTMINQADLDALSEYGITVNGYGTLILPYDYLAYMQAPNLVDFTANVNILKIPSTKYEIVDGCIVYRGAMTKLFTENYERLFAARGYIEITLANGETMMVYTNFDEEENVRSIRQIAQAFKADTQKVDGKPYYPELSTAKKEVVDAYAASDIIDLMNYASYENNVFDSIAWYYPELDPTNEYNNEYNNEIARKMKAAGIKTVYLDGQYHINLNTGANIEKTRQIIKFFWENHQIETIAFGSNSSNNCAIDYATTAYPDFSDCPGFKGFLAWDEPYNGDADMQKLADFAKKFEETYAGTDVTFMVNLFPAYASMFQKESGSWWQSNANTLNKSAYQAYLKDYCDKVLSQISGEKWLSMDSYPINKDKSLGSTFLFDLAMVKYYAEYAGATSHAVLQASGWTEDGYDGHSRMPTVEEMRMQAYAAMAFGIDSISWWSYSDKREDNQSNATDNEDYYNRYATVNNELNAISSVYSAFDWKGVILGAGTNNGKNIMGWDATVDKDYQAYALVQGQIGDYELTVADTKHIASVSTNKTDWNYLMGVMEDANGNEGYVLCNYNAQDSDKAQTITIKFDSNITEVVIYRGGVAETVTVNSKTLTVNLASGEGVIILPSKLG